MGYLHGLLVVIGSLQRQRSEAGVREKIQAPKKGRVWVKPEAQVQGASNCWNKQGSRSSVGLAGDMQLHWVVTLTPAIGLRDLC